MLKVKEKFDGALQQQLYLLPPSEIGESEAYLQEQIITYIGNKRSLLPFIGKGLDLVKRRLNKPKLRALDIFSGSGVVARYFKQHAEHIIANDLESYCKVLNECYLSNQSSLDWDELNEILHHLRGRIKETWSGGFITELYSPKDENNISPEDRVFYTRRNAMYLDTARKAIMEVPEDKQKYFLAPLLSEASVHANTSGVFKGFYKSGEGIGQFGGNGKDALTRILGNIEVTLPVLSRYETSFEFYQKDANQIVSDLEEVDVAYFDPPYNQHPYGSNYFMLNLLSDYKTPMEVSRVSGIPKNWNRSRYNQKDEAEDALFDLVAKCKAKFVLISYNSEGFISYDRFLARLKDCGQITVLETSYNTFRGSRNLRERPIHVTEFLYLLEKK